MASLIDDLNDLLMRSRAGYEAARLTADEVEETDPDIESGLEDIVEAERWTSSGLYHRITQLGGTPNLDVGDFPSRVAERDDLRERIKMLCRQQESAARLTKSVLDRDDLDQPTRDLLLEIRTLYLRNAKWCKQIMRQWEPDWVPGYGSRTS